VPAPTDLEVLARALGLAALIAASLEYAILLRHRTARRMAHAVAETQDAGLRGLVRVLLTDG
jgi:hypothetical protein